MSLFPRSDVGNSACYAEPREGGGDPPAALRGITLGMAYNSPLFATGRGERVQARFHPRDEAAKETTPEGYRSGQSRHEANQGDLPEQRHSVVSSIRARRPMPEEDERRRDALPVYADRPSRDGAGPHVPVHRRERKQVQRCTCYVDRPLRVRLMKDRPVARIPKLRRHPALFGSALWRYLYGYR